MYFNTHKYEFCKRPSYSFRYPHKTVIIPLFELAHRCKKNALILIKATLTNRISKGMMMKDEAQKSKVRWITEAEYIDQLNALRKQHNQFTDSSRNAQSDIQSLNLMEAS
jgi:hypothetical protein